MTSRRHGKALGIERYLAPVIAGVSFLVLWALTTHTGAIEPWRLPSPALTVDRAIKLLSDPEIWGRIGLTVLEAITGCFLGTLIALPLAVALYSSRLLSAALEPYLGVSQSLPAIAIAPLLVLWLGYGVFPIAALCALMVFFPILITTLLGMRTLDSEVLEAACLDGASGVKMLKHIILPLTLPAILAGVRNGFTLSFTGAIVGEMVMGGEGLGQVLTQSRNSLDTAGMFVIIGLLCVLATTIYTLVLHLESRLLVERFGA